MKSYNKFLGNQYFLNIMKDFIDDNESLKVKIITNSIKKIKVSSNSKLLIEKNCKSASEILENINDENISINAKVILIANLTDKVIEILDNNISNPAKSAKLYNLANDLKNTLNSLQNTCKLSNNIGSYSVLLKNSISLETSFFKSFNQLNLQLWDEIHQYLSNNYQNTEISSSIKILLGKFVHYLGNYDNNESLNKLTSTNSFLNSLEILYNYFFENHKFSYEHMSSFNAIQVFKVLKLNEYTENFYSFETMPYESQSLDNSSDSISFRLSSSISENEKENDIDFNNNTISFVSECEDDNRPLNLNFDQKDEKLLAEHKSRSNLEINSAVSFIEKLVNEMPNKNFSNNQEPIAHRTRSKLDDKAPIAERTRSKSHKKPKRTDLFAKKYLNNASKNRITLNK